MRKSALLFYTLLFSISFFSYTHIASADNTPILGATNITPTQVVESDGSITIKITGSVTQEGYDNLHPGWYQASPRLVATWLKSDSGTPTFDSSWLILNAPKCTVASDRTFECLIEKTATLNTYYFEIGSWIPASGRSSWTGFSEMMYYQVKEAVGATPPSATFESVTVSGHNAEIKFKVQYFPDGSVGYLQLGTAKQQGETSNYTCSALNAEKPYRSQPITLPKGAGVKFVSYTFNPETTGVATSLPDGKYCIRPEAINPATKKSVVLEKGVGETDANGFWASRGAIFAIGNETIKDGGTNSTKANALGCVAGENNSGYCLLAPLPGIGDEKGYLDVTTGMGNYINMIIKLVMGLIGVLSVLMVVVGGIEYMSTVSVGEKEGAKSRITNALFGLLLTLSAYLILKTINPKLVDLTINVPEGAITDFNDVIEDVEYDESGEIIPSDTDPKMSGITVPGGPAQDLAKQILNNSKIRLDTSLCGGTGSKSTAKQNIVDTAAGKLAWTTKEKNNAEHQVSLDSKMLGAILAIANNYGQIQVNAIAGCGHGDGSDHYAGRGFDIQAVPHGEVVNSNKIMNICKAAGAKMSKTKGLQIFGPCKNSNFPSMKKCPYTDYRSNTAHETHIHCGF